MQDNIQEILGKNPEILDIDLEEVFIYQFCLHCGIEPLLQVSWDEEPKAPETPSFYQSPVCIQLLNKIPTPTGSPFSLGNSGAVPSSLFTFHLHPSVCHIAGFFIFAKQSDKNSGKKKTEYEIMQLIGRASLSWI